MNKTSLIWLSLIVIYGCIGIRQPLLAEDSLLKIPAHGYISRQQTSKWEESMLTGNGTLGALVPGDPVHERIILSHEKLFMPEYPPAKALPLYREMDLIKKLKLNGMGEKAAELAVKLGEEVGIKELIWTDPLIPACQLEIMSLNEKDVTDYVRAVNYETGEAAAAWQASGRTFERRVFMSRVDGIGVLKMTASGPGGMNLKMRLSQLPIDPEEAEEEGWDVNEVIESAVSGYADGMLNYITKFKKRWPGSLKGYVVEARIIAEGGTLHWDGIWLNIRETKAIRVLTDVRLSWALPLERITRVDRYIKHSYETLLERHRLLHSELFNRFSLSLGDGSKVQTSQSLIEALSAEKASPALVNALCEAARYILISSTGELPPTLQGIWGGTWRPAWSGDFTLNGNVPSAIACGLNGHFPEATLAYLDMMWGFFEDFKANARDLYRAPGIFVPSRCSDSGKCYHFNADYPHLFWYAGAAWTSQFFYDYWQYTGDMAFLKNRAVPFMLAAAEFYEFILTEDGKGGLMFLPSYSPEVGPVGMHPLAINATMDVAALKQLARNLLALEAQGLLKTKKTGQWKKILECLPAYAVDETGDLKEWIWPGYENNNSHRHASHLYPLFYEVDPAFEADPALMEAAVTAIENRLQYRRERNGAEMAFGLVQKGLAAAHIGDTAHAYECVSWLCSSYWSPAFTSYHDPGEIFNVDICGGLPAVVIEMIVQSTAEDIFILPALPRNWPDGEIRGVRARGGFIVDLKWKAMKPVGITVRSLLGNDARIHYYEDVHEIELLKEEEKTILF